MEPRFVNTNCPNCRKPLKIELWDIFDLDKNPELVLKFLNAKINCINCSRCGHMQFVYNPVAFHDPQNKRLLFYIPDDLSKKEEANYLWQLLLPTLSGPPDDYLFKPIIVENPEEVVDFLWSPLKFSSRPKADPNLQKAIMDFTLSHNLWEQGKVILENPALASEETVSIITDWIITEKANENVSGVNYLTEDRKKLVAYLKDISHPPRTTNTKSLFGVVAALKKLSSEQQEILLHIMQDLLRTSSSFEQFEKAMGELLNEVLRPFKQSEVFKLESLIRVLLAITDKYTQAEMWGKLNGQLGMVLQQKPNYTLGRSIRQN